MIDNCADDWRIAMTWQRITQIGMELVICAVHPIPGEYYFLWTTKLSNHGGKIGSQWVPVDVTLSLPMFLRLYLICRYAVHLNLILRTQTRVCQFFSWVKSVKKLWQLEFLCLLVKTVCNWSSGWKIWMKVLFSATRSGNKIFTIQYRK